MRSASDKGWGSVSAAVLAVGFTWLVLGGLVLWASMELRHKVRAQILARDGHVLTAMARVQQDGAEGVDEWEMDPLAVFMYMARREGIVAAWLFDSEGELEASLPAALREGSVPAEARAALQAGTAFSRYLPSVVLSEVFLIPELLDGRGPARSIPALEVCVPLGSGEGGVALFLIEASGLAEQFRVLDRQLWFQGLSVLGVAMVLTGVTLGWVFGKLEKAHRLLARRTVDLQHANQELSRSARVAALGAVTAHLVHGLKNPVSGLRTFVSSKASEGEGADGDWREAKAAMDRMQALIHDVIQVIREKEAELEYEVPLRELGEWVLQRAGPSAERRGIRLVVEGAAEGCMDNRTSGLLSLILGNLVENAIEATREGGAVKLLFREQAGGTVCEVVDEGAGIPADLWPRLFQPQASTKAGGSGLGLAITRQLALALGGDVRLVSSDARGTTFRVEVPARSGTGNGSGASDSDFQPASGDGGSGRW